MAMLGWVGGVICLILGGLVTFYSYNLLSLVLEHHAQLGKRQLRFRDMAHDILGTFFCFLRFSFSRLFNLNNGEQNEKITPKQTPSRLAMVTQLLNIS